MKQSIIETVSPHPYLPMVNQPSPIQGEGFGIDSLLFNQFFLTSLDDMKKQFRQRRMRSLLGFYTDFWYHNKALLEVKIKHWLSYKQPFDNCFFTNMCYNEITPVITLLEVL